MSDNSEWAWKKGHGDRPSNNKRRRELQWKDDRFCDPILYDGCHGRCYLRLWYWNFRYVLQYSLSCQLSSYHSWPLIHWHTQPVTCIIYAMLALGLYSFFLVKSFYLYCYASYEMEGVIFGSAWMIVCFPISDVTYWSIWTILYCTYYYTLIIMFFFFNFFIFCLRDH